MEEMNQHHQQMEKIITVMEIILKNLKEKNQINKNLKDFTISKVPFNIIEMLNLLVILENYSKFEAHDIYR